MNCPITGNIYLGERLQRDLRLGRHDHYTFLDGGQWGPLRTGNDNYRLHIHPERRLYLGDYNYDYYLQNMSTGNDTATNNNSTLPSTLHVIY